MTQNCNTNVFRNRVWEISYNRTDSDDVFTETIYVFDELKPRLYQLFDYGRINITVIEVERTDVTKDYCPLNGSPDDLED